MGRVLAAAAWVGLMAVAAVAAARPPAAANADGKPPATAPADDARRVFADVLRELHTSPNLTLEVARSAARFAAEPATQPDDQAGLNWLDDDAQRIVIHRPDKLRFSSGWAPQPAGDAGSHLVVFDGSTVCVARRQADGRLRGTFGRMDGRTADDVCRADDCDVRFLAPELARLLDADAERQTLRYADGWEWLGAATDNGTAVWRIRFAVAEPAYEARSWEAWVTQDSPRRLTRLVVGGPSSMLIFGPKPGVTASDAELLGDPSKSVQTTYKTRTRVEIRFTRWDTTTRPKPADFERPAGEFKERPFRESEPTYKVGDVVPLPTLADVDGNAVDLSRHAGPLVLDFWFAACGPCMYWTPHVEALVDEFAGKGAALYGVNVADDPAKAKQVATQEGWTHVTTLVDADRKYRLLFTIVGYPTVVVIGADGRLLYREFPGKDGAMDRLRDVLKSATTGAPGPTTRAAASDGAQ